ncbi:MAG: quinone-dependent dihydroorotate dehydrogenase [Acetobacteraceae bacterium]|nr:quinone-dependent dihydroorotate dehydrogenase [Acetobacteraceae bacterium]
MLPAAFASRLMPLVRCFDPEAAHRAALSALRLGLVSVSPPRRDPRLAVSAMGLSFANPLGLAAGFDKDAEAIRPLFGLGFGFVEAGGVTLRPQPGNPRPRVFRLQEDRAVINRLGLNSAGWPAVKRRLERLREQAALPGPLFLNLAPNRDAADPVADTARLVAEASPLVEGCVLNVSSPNTPGLRDWQEGERLAILLRAAKDARGASQARLLLKIAPDLDRPALAAIVEAAVAHGIDGLIVANTTVARPASLRSRHASEAGGLSGQPLFAPSTALLREAARLARGRLVLLGCGGVASAEQAYAKIRAGASLVQLYTGLIYEGPGLVARILAGLSTLLAADGFASVAQAVGADLAEAGA